MATIDDLNAALTACEATVQTKYLEIQQLRAQLAAAEATIAGLEASVAKVQEINASVGTI